jgi:hypothetical protein
VKVKKVKEEGDFGHGTMEVMGFRAIIRKSQKILNLYLACLLLNKYK